MNFSFYIGRLFGIKLYMHWTFLILLAWVFIVNFRESSNIFEGLFGVSFILLLFACVILHELGHALAARKFDFPTERIVLLPIGGMAQMKELPENPIQELWVAIAGPLVNVAIAFILFIVILFGFEFNMESLAVEITHLSIKTIVFNLLAANIILFVFNLLPAFPMDGGRILRALLAFKFTREKATKIAATVGQVIAIIFVLIGVFYNIWLVFIGVFIFLGAGSESKFETVKHSLSGYKVKDILMSKYTPVYTNTLLQDVVKILLEGQEREFIVVDSHSNEVTGILTREDIINGLSKYGDGVEVSKIMNVKFIKLQHDFSLKDAYKDMVSNGFEVCPVYEKGILVGILNKENIDELLMLDKASKAYTP